MQKIIDIARDNFFDASAMTPQTDSAFVKFMADLVVMISKDRNDVDAIVSDILGGIDERGDLALLEYTNKFDAAKINTIEELQVSKTRLKKALRSISKEQHEALKSAAKRIKNYHKQQLRRSAKDWSYTEADGTVLGQKVTPLDRVGIYIPGGKASYPSTVLMTAIPAKVAGVSEVIMVTPTRNGEINDMVLAAASIAGVDKIFTVGGAQAIGALAYGTNTIPHVDKIVGPGNIYVATAKRKVASNAFIPVAVDMEAGPSEILVICDGKTNPDWIALDLLSQAEHDEMAQSILISTDKGFIDQVIAAIKKVIPTLDRKDIAGKSMAIRGAFILVKDMDQACEISNRIAPEHLELAVENPRELLPKIKHAGAIFLGKYTSEALGDYVAGPSHVLPTSGTARFSSPLGVYDFQKRSSIIECTAQGASELGKIASVLARGESLTAHARSAEARIKK